jgi:hypothetical protein
MYCVIKCLKSTRVLKGKFTSSAFHSCKKKRQRREFSSPVRTDDRTAIHFTSSSSISTVQRVVRLWAQFGVSSELASCLSKPYGKQYQHGGRANSRCACSYPRTVETRILPGKRECSTLHCSTLLGRCCTLKTPGYRFLWNRSNCTASYPRTP